MKIRKSILLFILVLFSTFINAQQLFTFNPNTEVIATKDASKTINLTINSDVESEIVSQNPSLLDLEIPFVNNENLNLRLERYKVYSDNLIIVSTTENEKETLNITPTILSYKVFYKNKSVGVLNLFNGEINATFQIDGSQYEISKFKENYVLFESSNSINHSTFSCAVQEEFQSQNQINNPQLPPVLLCLELALEIDNYTRNTFSSNLSTTNWALAIMAGVSQIYELEVDVSIQVVYTNIWNSVDPYASYNNQASNMLTELRTYWNTNNGTVSRDLVHMMTKRNNTGTGGIAYTDVLCNSNWGYGFSASLDNDTTYNFPNPSYTWNLTVCSHEIGHNFGSHHTHWCDWVADPTIPFAGGVIDNCVDVQGSCSNNPTPVLGTIMSYCHTTSGGSILNFHDVVVSQALIPGKNAAFCLDVCDYYGCTDSTSFNYDPAATIDDSSCILIIFGCIDTIALNFDSTANTDDGNCTYCSMLTIVSSDISCFGNNDGSIDLQVAGGTAPFTYSWFSPSGFTSNTEDLSSLSPSVYYVTVTDSIGCSELTSVIIFEPDLISIASSSVTDVSCNGFSDGSVILNIFGGTSPYTENWGIYNPNNLLVGSYVVSVTDVNNCPVASTTVFVNEPLPLTIIDNVNDISCNSYNDGSILINPLGGTLPYNFNWTSTNGYFSINEDIINLQSGTYTLLLTDGNACTESFSYYISEPPVLLLNSTVTNATCYGAMDGSINLTVIGGVTPYNFVWSNGAITEDLNNIPSSNYWVNVIDDNQCAISTQYFTISQPAISIVNSVQTNVSCNGFTDGGVDITFIPSTSGAVSYLWSGPNSFSSVNEDISSLETGLYTLTITELPCIITESFYINEPSSISVSENIQDVSCYNEVNGVINLTISGGTPPFSQNWFGVNPTSMPAGVFQYVITDDNNCIFSNTVTVNQPQQAIFVTSSQSDVSCNGGNNATAQLSISGGISPYITVWQNANPIQLSAGYNVFSVTDNNQCVFTDSILIWEPPAISVIELITDVSCNGKSDGIVNLIISGGTSPYSENWGFNNNSSLSSGSYIYSVSDANSCQYSSLVTVSEPLSISIIPTTINSTCPNSTDGSVQLSISGGTPPYTENWGINNPNNLSSGIFNYTITDNNQCVDSLEIVISSVSNISVQEFITDISCFGFCDGNANLYISAGIAPYSVNWNSFFSDSLCEGDYYYTITDSLQCVYSDSIHITEPSDLNLSVSQQTSQLTANVSGGNPPYTYQWWNNSGNLGTFSAEFIFSAGTYYCIVFDVNLCHSDTVMYFVSEVGLEENSNNNFDVYPNPFSDNIHILFNNSESKNIKIFDAIGQVVFRKTTFEKSIDIDTKRFANSIYFIEIKSGEKNFYQKIIKE
ncbi:MAG: T9SS type A sorting domain-containing protein [Flavobacteriales bacterium]|nr:T9SS type A sorting domain-containing protein [Flavobacteriales bacterium]